MLSLKDPRVEGPFLASKWQKTYVFLSPEELKALFQFWEIEKLFLIGKILKTEETLNLQDWLSQYKKHFDDFWKKGGNEKLLKELTPAVITKDHQALYRQNVEEGYLIHVKEPCLLIQEHWFRCSKVDEKFYPKTFGENSIFWGLEFSYPQIFQEAKTKEIHHLNGKSPFINTQLFILLRKWIRDFTKPAVFLLGEKKYKTQFRVGKDLEERLKEHPHLRKLEIEYED